MFKITFASRLASLFPDLKRQIRIAHFPFTNVDYISKSIKVGLLYSIIFSIFALAVLHKANLSLFLLIPIFIIFAMIFFFYSMMQINSTIAKRERNINKEVLFIGRYLLVKLYSGRPLLNALIETANSRGIGAHYIKELVDDITTGSTMEKALNNAIDYSPSKKLKRILFHINNAMSLGIDVTGPLESVLDELTKEQEIEIKKYGKKLNTLVIMYMLAAIVLPSLGVVITIIITTLISFVVDIKMLMVLLFFLIVIQLTFISIFKSMRPDVNL